MSAVLRLTIESGPNGALLHLTPPRAPDPAVLLRGKAPEQAMALVPLLFNLCPAAHRIAAALALGRPVSPAWLRQLAEEHLRHQAIVVLRDWPVALGRSYRPESLRGLAALSPDRLQMLTHNLETCGGDVIGMVGEWSQDWGRTDRSLQERLRQRLIGALHLCEQVRQGVFETAYGLRQPGVGWALAARGRLVHKTRVSSGCIAAYAIDTPTDRMIRDGSLYGLLAAALKAPVSVREHVFAIALTCADPCTEIELVRTGDALHA